MKIYLETYGCTANKSDASIILGLLKQNNHQITNKMDDSDVLILLTCTVIGTTEQRMLSRLRKYKKFKKKIIVTGCMASIQSDLVKSILPNAYLIHPKKIHQIIRIINDQPCDKNLKNKQYAPKHFEDINAPISIAEGCMFSCSYCITSPARGQLISYEADEIERDIRDALSQNCKEIQLTAQDTASYGLDIKSNLGKLLTKICKIEGDYKIRVGMMNPYTALLNLDSIKNGYNNEKIFKFLHLPVQSGDNDILHLMNRKYLVNDFLKIIKKFRDKYPQISISTDIIVGFPNETEEQFDNSVNLIERIKPDIVNVTRYSARPNTKAKSMKGRISTKIAKDRSKYLVDICKKLSFDKNLKYNEKILSVLILKKGNNGFFIGRTDNYKPVIINEKVKIGERKNIKIIDTDSIHLFGKLI